LSQKGESAQAGQTAQTGRRRDDTILLVDDDENTRVLVRMMLKKLVMILFWKISLPTQRQGGQLLLIVLDLVPFYFTIKLFPHK